jgi:CelD/BcsL family acetyltransferase involved in cellulose biosynthesis
MPQADLLHPHAETAETPAAPGPARPVRGADAGLELWVTSDLAGMEEEWRAFEAHADCTAFQCYDWLSAWQRHIGARTGTTPVLVVGRHAGETTMILPLAVTRRASGRQLAFLGRDLGDYNAPLLAFDFHRKFSDFKPIWSDIRALLRRDAHYRHDVVLLDKMPERVGAQPNPFVQLEVGPHPSGAYLARLGDDWEAFYATKRSSATRRRDRSKRKRLAENGAVTLMTPVTQSDTVRTAERLIAQKARAFERMGVPDIFARPGYREFFMDIATNPATRSFAHVSSLNVGDVAAATNLGLCFRGTYCHVLASYDDGPLARFGPGAAHLHELMRYAIERGCTLFDFTVGDEPYKRDWCDVEMKLYDHVSTASARGLLAATVLSAFRSVKRAIKQSPRLWPSLLKLRAGVGSLRRRLLNRP